MSWMVNKAFLKACPKHLFTPAILYIFFSFPNSDTNWWSSVLIPTSTWRRGIFHSTTTAGSVVMYPVLMTFSNVSLSPCGCRCGDFRVHFRQKALGFINIFLFFLPENLWTRLSFNFIFPYSLCYLNFPSLGSSVDTFYFITDVCRTHISNLN